MYADYAYYRDEFGGEAAQEAIEPKLEAASDTIDALTFGRIEARGFDSLTQFQQGKVKRACCMQAAFLLENADAVESAMTSYAINGVSMEFGNAALYCVVDGVPVSNMAKKLLEQTGLSCRLAYGREVDSCVGPVW